MLDILFSFQQPVQQDHLLHILLVFASVLHFLHLISLLFVRRSVTSEFSMTDSGYAKRRFDRSFNAGMSIGNMINADDDMQQIVVVTCKQPQNTDITAHNNQQKNWVCGTDRYNAVVAKDETLSDERSNCRHCKANKCNDECRKPNAVMKKILSKKLSVFVCSVGYLYLRRSASCGRRWLAHLPACGGQVWNTTRVGVRDVYGTTVRATRSTTWLRCYKSSASQHVACQSILQDKQDVW